MTKGDFEITEPDSDNHMDDIGVEETVAATSKKAKVSDKNAVVTKQGLDSYLERGMTESEKDQANVWMLRCCKSYLELDHLVTKSMSDFLFMGIFCSGQQRITFS